jgi:hypothetical protein
MNSYDSRKAVAGCQSPVVRRNAISARSPATGNLSIEFFQMAEAVRRNQEHQRNCPVVRYMYDEARSY